MTAHRSLTFRRDPREIRAARGALAGLNGQLTKTRLYDASLCLSELVSNAIRHPGVGDEVSLTVALDEDRLRVEVTDPGGGFDPQPRARRDDGGWGLFIVEELSDDWGIEAGDRTVVWFEILRAPVTN